MVGIIVIAIVIFVIFIAPNWMDSDNDFKQNIGCTAAIIVVVVGFLISFIGTCKNYSGKSPSYDYYDAPRK